MAVENMPEGPADETSALSIKACMRWTSSGACRWPGRSPRPVQCTGAPGDPCARPVSQGDVMCGAGEVGDEGLKQNGPVGGGGELGNESFHQSIPVTGGPVGGIHGRGIS